MNRLAPQAQVSIRDGSDDEVHDLRLEHPAARHVNAFAVEDAHRYLARYLAVMVIKVSGHLK